MIKISDKSKKQSKRSACIITLMFALKKPSEENIKILMEHLENEYSDRKLTQSEGLDIIAWCKVNCKWN